MNPPNHPSALPWTYPWVDPSSHPRDYRFPIGLLSTNNDLLKRNTIVWQSTTFSYLFPVLSLIPGELHQWGRITHLGVNDHEWSHSSITPSLHQLLYIGWSMVDHRSSIGLRPIRSWPIMGDFVRTLYRNRSISRVCGVFVGCSVMSNALNVCPFI